MFNKLPYMNIFEKEFFEEIVEKGEITVFKCRHCGGINCSELVPNVKRFCSFSCYKSIYEDETQDQKSEDEDV